MKDIRDNWFFKQHYTHDEINLLWKWISEGGSDVEVKFHDGVWSGFHPLDKEMKIDLAGQSTQEDCINWMKRLGFGVMN